MSAPTLNNNEPASCCFFINQPQANTPTPDVKDTIHLSRKIQNFTEKHIPLTSDRCLKRLPGCLSCPPENCVHSGRGEPMMELCHCWTCCFGKVHGRDVTGLYNFLYYLIKEHNVHCVANTILNNNIHLGTLMRQHGDISEDLKKILKEDCCNIYKQLNLEEAKEKCHAARNEIIDSIKDPFSAIHLVIEVWNSATKQDAQNLSNTDELWIENKEGVLSPFCSKKIEAFLSSVTFLPKGARKNISNLRLPTYQTVHIALQTKITLACIINNAAYRERLLTVKKIDDKNLLVCPTSLLYCIILSSLELANKIPSKQRKHPVKYFSREESQIITNSLEKFRRRLLGEFLNTERSSKKRAYMEPREPKHKKLKIRSFSNPMITIKIQSDEDRSHTDYFDPDEGPSSRKLNENDL